jgi:hypothetical protein
MSSNPGPGVSTQTVSALQWVVIIVGISVGLLHFLAVLLGYADNAMVDSLVAVTLISCCVLTTILLVRRIQVRIATITAEMTSELNTQAQFQNNPFLQVDLEALAAAMQSKGGVEIQDRRYRLKIYASCFVGAEAVDWLVQNRGYSRQEAAEVGQEMMRRDLIAHVSDDQPFQDSYFFYRFTRDFKLPVQIQGSQTSKLTTNLDWQQIATAMFGSEGVDIRDRRYHFTIYPNCFVGNEAVDWLVQRYDLSRKEAVEVGQILHQNRIIHHVVDEHDFKDAYLFYEQLPEAEAYLTSTAESEASANGNGWNTPQDSREGQISKSPDPSSTHSESRNSESRVGDRPTQS